MSRTHGLILIAAVFFSPMAARAQPPLPASPVPPPRLVEVAGQSVSEGPITLADVAREAGTSPSTASRALSGRGYVAPDVRKRLVATAERLGYVPNLSARTLKQRTSRVVGVIVSDLSNQFYAALAAGIEQSLREAVRRGDGYIGVEHLLIATLRADEGGARRTLEALGVDPGALVARI